MIPGLVSVSFRKLLPEEVADLCVKAGFSAIEWGGDIHVPAGNLQRAMAVKAVSAARGMKIAAYGSYYHLGGSRDDFLRNLDTAAKLGAPTMRIWAGSRGSALVSAEERKQLVEEFSQDIFLAQEAGITLVPEFHGNTLTDTAESLSQLMKELPELRYYWQPRWDWSEDKCLASLDMISEKLVSMHVFSWRIENGKEIRLPLAAGEILWKKAFARGKKDTCALMEFVRDDDPEVFLADAETLKRWLDETA